MNIYSICTSPIGFSESFTYWVCHRKLKIRRNKMMASIAKIWHKQIILHPSLSFLRLGLHWCQQAIELSFCSTPESHRPADAFLNMLFSNNHADLVNCVLYHPEMNWGSRGEKRGKKKDRKKSQKNHSSYAEYTSQHWQKQYILMTWKKAVLTT